MQLSLLAASGLPEQFAAANTIWVLVGAALVFFMQAGFAMVETGFTRAKNAGNIVMKNLMDFAIGAVVFFAVGYGFMFGADTGGFIGTPGFFGKGEFPGASSAVDPMAFLIFQTVFCATAATIVSGAMAERTKFAAYCVYSLVISAVIYPISGHWIWGGGWLSQMGFHDFAGSTAVHMVGGVAALVGAKLLGPRIGKYPVLGKTRFGAPKYGKPRAIPGHSLTLGALGVFILWFCWFGFNGTSTLGMFDAAGNFVAATASRVFVTTNLAPAVAACAAMLITWIRYRKPDVSMTLNAALGGLVAITAGCDLVSPLGACVIGLVAAFVIVFGIELVDKALKIDDPVGAIGVHGLCGAIGTILTGMLAVPANGAAGIFYDFLNPEAWRFFGTQVLGVAVVALWVAVTITLVFLVIKKTMGLRVSHAEEIQGLDVNEHGIASSYADFMPATDPEMLAAENEVMRAEGIPSPETAVPVTHYTAAASNAPKLTKLTVIAKREKFLELRDALDAIGVTGMTVTEVLGCGAQRGQQEFYRGVPVETNLLPKVKLEIVVSKLPVEDVIAAVRKALYTGHIGDGKIFVSDVEDVVRVRTNERGCDALQDDKS